MMPRQVFQPCHEDALPVYIKPSWVAKILKCHTRTVKRMWDRNGIAIRRDNGHMVTTPELLRRSFPEIYERLQMTAYHADELIESLFAED